MMKPNLSAAQEREARLTKLGDALQVLERHVDSRRWPMRLILRPAA